MISCTEFIPAYSELFKFLEKKGGKEAVVDFWKYLSEKYLTDSLKKSVEEEGIKGCFTYWNHTLNEEAADFEMILCEEKGEFTIEMFKCPSKSLLLETDHIEPYKDYCEHCDWLYRLILEPLGYSYETDLSKCGEAKCKLIIKKIK